MRKARVEVRKGDTWEETAKAAVGRRVVVEVAVAPMGQVVCRSVSGGRPTRICRERLECGKGWRLVSRAESPAIAVSTTEQAPSNIQSESDRGAADAGR